MFIVAKTLKIDKPTSEEIDGVFSDLDLNKDEKLSLEEFESLIRKVLKIMSIMETEM
jgi:hypothetical protein